MANFLVARIPQNGFGVVLCLASVGKKKKEERNPNTMGRRHKKRKEKEKKGGEDKQKRKTKTGQHAEAFRLAIAAAPHVPVVHFLGETEGRLRLNVVGAQGGGSVQDHPHGELIAVSHQEDHVLVEVLPQKAT